MDRYENRERAATIVDDRVVGGSGRYAMGPRGQKRSQRGSTSGDGSVGAKTHSFSHLVTGAPHLDCRWYQQTPALGNSSFACTSHVGEQTSCAILHKQTIAGRCSSRAFSFPFLFLSAGIPFWLFAKPFWSSNSRSFGECMHLYFLAFYSSVPFGPLVLGARSHMLPLCITYSRFASSSNQFKSYICFYFGEFASWRFYRTEWETLVKNKELQLWFTFLHTMYLCYPAIGSGTSMSASPACILDIKGITRWRAHHSRYRLESPSKVNGSGLICTSVNLIIQMTSRTILWTRKLSGRCEGLNRKPRE